MSFNVLKEKGTALDKQLRSCHDIALIPFNKTEVDCYTRTRQILMNGIDIEAVRLQTRTDASKGDCDW